MGRIAFYGNSQVEVILNVEEKAQPHIRKDSKARISTDGLVGNKIVIIVPIQTDVRRQKSYVPPSARKAGATISPQNGYSWEVCMIQMIVAGTTT